MILIDQFASHVVQQYQAGSTDGSRLRWGMIMADEVMKVRPEIWKKFLRRHWQLMVVGIIGIVLALVGSILVYLWFVGDAQSSGLVPETLDLWTMGHLITFILNLIFWELLLIGIPVVVGVLAAYTVWKRLPIEEREEYRRGNLFRSKSKGRDVGNGFSFLINIGFIVKVYLDGNWDSPFSTWSFDYLVYSYLVVLIVLLAIFGIPAVIGGTWWLRRELRRAG